MDAMTKFLNFLYTNWTGIITCILLILGMTKKTMDFFKKSKQDQLDIAKKQIKETILKLVAEAENDYSYMIAAGKIKRSQVIEKIIVMYPALSKVIDQEEIIVFIDECIDDALDILRDVIEKNESSFVITTKEEK